MSNVPIPAHQRDTYEATNELLNHIDGLIAALDLVQDHIKVDDNTSPASMAFHAITPLLREKMAAVWGCRHLEWRGLGGSAGE